MSKLSLADSHDNQQNIIEKAKEINQKVKEKQANTKANISSEIGNEEPLPLNDPFVGDSSLSGGGTLLASDPNEAQNEMSLYKFTITRGKLHEFVIKPIILIGLKFTVNYFKTRNFSYFICK